MPDASEAGNDGSITLAPAARADIFLPIIKTRAELPANLTLGAPVLCQP